MNNNLIIHETINETNNEFISEIDNKFIQETNNEFIDEINIKTDIGTNNETNNEFNTNCVALTIRKEYRLTVASNIVKTIKRVFLKILANLGILNFFNIMF